MNEQFLKLMGIHCAQLDDEGKFAMVEMPFTFQDGDTLPIFIEREAGRVRFYDDCGVFFQLWGRRVLQDEEELDRKIVALCAPSGVTMNDQGELEIWSSEENAPAAFAHYLLAMLAIARWEHQRYDAVMA